jgi:hypothetical protein
MFFLLLALVRPLMFYEALLFKWEWMDRKNAAFAIPTHTYL